LQLHPRKAGGTIGSCCKSDRPQFPADKYLQFEEDTIMDTTDQQHESLTGDNLDAQREVIRQSLDTMSAEMGIALKEAHLNFPLGLTIPSSGNAIVTMITPSDGISDEDWSYAGAIVCHIVSKKLGGIRLQSRSLICTMVHAPMSALDVTADKVES
jgi:hypothetical protein